MSVLPIRVLYEDWGEVTLPDGTMIRYRPTLTLVVEEDTDKWQFRWQHQYQVNAPESLKRPAKPNTKRLGQVAGVVTQGRAHASYEVDGRTIHITRELKKIFRTDGYDGNGDPIFNIDHHDEIKVHGGPEKPPTPTPV